VIKVKALGKLNYYLKNFFFSRIVPSYFYRRELYKILARKLTKKQQERVDYYCKSRKSPKVTELECSVYIRNLLKLGTRTYHWDLMEYLRYFPQDFKFEYLFGDVTEVPKKPTILKSRPISGQNQNAVLINLDKARHMNFVKDQNKFEDKKNCLVWRGGAYQRHRKAFLEKFWDHPMCNLGQTNKPKENSPWQKPRMSIAEQLTYKFIFSIEGNDVATNLKWALSSNSLVFMTKPKFETWFMEGKLIPNYHYVLLLDDYSNLEKEIEYYSDSKNFSKAKKIIRQANSYTLPFQDQELEKLIAIHVLNKYFENSGQSLRFFSLEK